MAQRKYGSAVVVSGRDIMGVFTTTDAMFALVDLLENGKIVESREAMPSRLRKRILDDHQVLRGEVAKLKKLAREYEEGIAENLDKLDMQVRSIYGMLLRHMNMEEHLLIPALRESDAFGAERVRLYKTEHESQRASLRHIVKSLGRSESEPRQYLDWVHALAESLLDDMEREEEEFLAAKILRDDTVSVEAFSG